MPKYPPGPWEGDYADHDQPYLNIKIRPVSNPRRTIGVVCIDDAPVEDFNTTQRAAADLMILAPELYESLAELLPWAASRLEGQSDHIEAILDRARSVLARVPGHPTP